MKTFPYDAGTIRFLATSEETGGAWAIVESRKLPGYKTLLHWHDDFEEAICVLESVMTAEIAGENYEFPAGSYFVIPRGTTHAQVYNLRDTTEDDLDFVADAEQAAENRVFVTTWTRGQYLS